MPPCSKKLTNLKERFCYPILFKIFAKRKSLTVCQCVNQLFAL